MPQVSDTPPPGVTPFAPPPGYRPPSAPSAPAPVTIQQGAPPGQAPTTLPTLPPGGNKPFANPPATSGEIREPTWWDTLNPSRFLGIEPGSPQQALQVASKVVPIAASALLPMAPGFQGLGPAGRALYSGATDFFGTGGDPVATAAGGIGGWVSGAVQKAILDPNKSTRFWTGFADAVSKGRPNLAPGIAALGGNTKKLAGYEGRRALQEAASAPFDAAMNQIERQVGADTAIELPMTLKHASDLGLWDMANPIRPNEWPTATFREMREVIKDLRFRDPDNAKLVENALATHLGRTNPNLVPLYERAKDEYRGDMDIIRELVNMQERRALPGGSLREDTDPGIVKAIDKITPPKKAPGTGVEGVVSMASPKLGQAVRAAQKVAPQGGVPPIQGPVTVEQLREAGRWGTGASVIPPFINAVLPTENRPRPLTPGYWMGQE